MNADTVKVAMVAAVESLAETFEGLAWDFYDEDREASAACTEQAIHLRKTAFALHLAPSVIAWEFAQDLTQNCQEVQEAADRDNVSWQEAYEEAVARYQATLPREEK